MMPTGGLNYETENTLAHLAVSFRPVRCSWIHPQPPNLVSGFVGCGGYLLFHPRCFIAENKRPENDQDHFWAEYLVLVLDAYHRHSKLRFRIDETHLGYCILHHHGHHLYTHALHTNVDHQPVWMGNADVSQHFCEKMMQKQGLYWQ